MGNRGPKSKLKTVLTKEFLTERYVVEQKSQPQIAAVVGCSTSVVGKYLKKHQIQTRTISESKKGKSLSKEHRESISRSLKGKMSGKKNPFFGRHHTEETKQKISKANTGNRWKHTEESKKKIRKANKGKRYSKTTREKIAKARKGTCHSEETRKKISKSVSGPNNPMWGKRHSKESLKKMSGMNNPMFGKTHSEEAKKKMSISSSGPLNPMFGKRGSETPGWKKPEDRITPLYKQIRYCANFLQWRESVFRRNNWSCQLCGDRSRKGHSVILHADHIKPLAVLIRENNITSLKAARTCGKLWDTSNGRTLCEDCHKKTDTWANGTKQILKKMK